MKLTKREGSMSCRVVLRLSARWVENLEKKTSAVIRCVTHHAVTNMCFASLPSTSPCRSKATRPPAPPGHCCFADLPMDPMSRNPWTPFLWLRTPGDEPHRPITARVGPRFPRSIYQHPRSIYQHPRSIYQHPCPSRPTHKHRWVNFYPPTPSKTASRSRVPQTTNPTSHSRVPQTAMIPCPNCDRKFRNTSGFKRHFSTIHQHHPGLDVPVTELRRAYHPTLTGMNLF